MVRVVELIICSAVMWLFAKRAQSTTIGLLVELIVNWYDVSEYFFCGNKYTGNFLL